MCQDIKTNVRKGLKIEYTNSNSYMEFDIWVPAKNIVFEFQVCGIIIYNYLFDILYLVIY